MFGPDEFEAVAAGAFVGHDISHHVRLLDFEVAPGWLALRAEWILSSGELRPRERVLGAEKKTSVRAARRSEKCLTHQREREPSSGRGIGRVTRCCGEVRFFHAIQLF